MLGYKQTEIPSGRRSWIWPLRQMSVGDEMVADPLDRTVIANVISKLHRENKTVKFRTKLSANKQDLFIIREK